MSNRPSIVCPVDFSEPSSIALNYAATVAHHFGARLLVVTIDDPLLAAAAENAGLQTLSQQTEEGLRRFVDSAVPHEPNQAATIEFVVTVGKPAAEILRLGRDSASDLIVMGSHGRSGITKKFFGSTTERVLHETSIPVLITPATAQRVAAVTDVSRHVQRVVAPVDLTEASPRQARVAAGIADGLGVPLLLAHVLEPMYVPQSVKLAIPGLDRDRRADAERQLRELLDVCGSRSSVETLILTGDASEEIASVAESRRAGLIVMGLHSSGRLGHSVGSVAYRVLCLTHALVLALPPTTDSLLASTTPWTLDAVRHPPSPARLRPSARAARSSSLP
jgi:nucleotide-binding universal stress UspA family protein